MFAMGRFAPPTNVAKTLHDLPRYSASLRSASNQFANTSEYGETLLVVLGFPIAFAVLYFLIEFAIRLYRHCKQKELSLIAKRQPLWLKVWVVILLLGCFGLVAAGLALNRDFSSSADTAVSALQRTESYYSSLVSSGQTLRQQGSSARADAYFLNESLVPPQNVRDAAAQIFTGINATNAVMARYASDLDRINFINKAPKSRLDDVSLSAVAFGLWLLSAILVAVVVLGGVRSKPLRRAADWFLVVVVFFAWVAASVILALCVGAADFCHDPAANLVQLAPSDQRLLASYYVYCNESYPSNFSNPLDTYLVTASTQVAQLGSTSSGPLFDIVQWNATNTDPASIALINRLTATLSASSGAMPASLTALRQLVKCDSVNGIATDLFDSGCGGLLTAAYSVCCFNFVVCVIFVWLRYMSTCGVCRCERDIPGEAFEPMLGSPLSPGSGHYSSDPGARSFPLPSRARNDSSAFGVEDQLYQGGTRGRNAAGSRF